MPSDQKKEPMENLKDKLRSLLGFQKRQKNTLPPKAHFSIWYFLIAIFLFTYLQQYFISAKVETIPYSQSKQYIAEVANRYGVDNLNALFLTPLPGTRLWDQMKLEDRIALDTFPEDWKYYTLTFPVARYKNLSLDGIIDEMICCDRDFYSMSRIVRRVWSSLWQRRKPLISLVGNFSYKNNLRLNIKAYADFKSYVKAGL